MKAMRKYTCIVFLVCSLFAGAQIPANYYSAAQGKSGEALRSALNTCIKDHTTLNYEGLQDYYARADFRPDGTLWEIYSTCEFTMEDLNKTQNDFCMGWNKEHSVPKSWFNSGSPMYSDMIHVIPTDARVNNLRGNEAYGETSSRSDEISLSSDALGHIGTSSFSGYSGIGKVYEPDDRYKGDIARIYFYMVTCYINKNFTTDNGAKMFSYTNSTNYLTDYSVALLMKWHRQDPVSYKEIARNDSVFACQGNRNPFVDFPDLAEYIWGNKTNTSFDLATILSAYSEEYVPLDTEGSNKTDYAKYGVSWFANDVELKSDSVFKNHKPTELPFDPTSCSANSNVFVGWTTTPINGATNTKPVDLFTSTVDAPAIQHNASFYAVFAHVEQGQGQGDVTATASFTTNDGYKQGQVVSGSTAGKVTITFNQASASNPTKFFTTGNAIRCYAGSNITMTGATISKVEFTFSTEDKTNPMTPNSGTLNGAVWKGSSSNLVFTIGGDSKYRAISAIKVTYDDNTTVFTYSDYLTSCNGQAISEVEAEAAAKKLLKDGQLYIIVGENMYTITGQEIK